MCEIIDCSTIFCRIFVLFDNFREDYRFMIFSLFSEFCLVSYPTLDSFILLNAF